LLLAALAITSTRRMAVDVVSVLASYKDPVSMLPHAALQLLSRSAVAACDKLYGVEDGIIDDPRQCSFDPATLKCAADQSPDTCLTPAQIETARRVYRGLKDPRTGAQLYPGLERGSEPAWPNRTPDN